MIILAAKMTNMTVTISDDVHIAVGWQIWVRQRNSDAKYQRWTWQRMTKIWRKLGPDIKVDFERVAEITPSRILECGAHLSSMKCIAEASFAAPNFLYTLLGETNGWYNSLPYYFNILVNWQWFHYHYLIDHFGRSSIFCDQIHALMPFNHCHISITCEK